MQNPIAERRQEEREQRIETFLQAAIQELKEVGVDKLTLASVAKRARLSKSLIYFYFKDKDELLFALANRAKEVLLGKFREARQKHEKGRDQLMAIGEVYLNFPYDHPDLWEIMAQIETVITPDESSSERYCEAAELGRATNCETASAIELGRQDGSLVLSEESPEQMATMLWAFCYGFNRLAASRGDAIEAICGVKIRELARSALTMIAVGLMAPPEVREQVHRYMREASRR